MKLIVKRQALNQQGRTEPGRVADVLAINRYSDLPVVKETWKNGARAC